MTFLLFSLVMRKFEQEMTEQRLNENDSGTALTRISHQAA
jgi:hypothetical protein